MSQVDRINPDDQGKFLITTQGSKHVWDNAEKTWVRMQQDGLNPMRHDGVECHITKVIRYPKVGNVFVVHYRKPKAYETWHQSSTIRRIEEIPDE